eukprot:15800058-Heterocapsa_arctica.AAC.1
MRAARATETSARVRASGPFARNVRNEAHSASSRNLVSSVPNPGIERTLSYEGPPTHGRRGLMGSL